MLKIFTKKNKFLIRIFSILVFIFFLSPTTSSADVLFPLLPGNINTCGELAVPGTYTLTSNVSNGADTCFLISSDNVIIEGGGYTVSGTGSTAIDGRVYTSTVLTEGANGYTNLIINDLNITGYTTGVNLSGNSDSTGNGINNGYAGDAGDANIFYSLIGSIVSNGGNSSTKTFGGLGGNISYTDTNLDISNSSISLVGGNGTSGKNTDGGLDLNYSGTLTHTNTTLSSLSFFNNNAISYGVYPGGSVPLSPGNISTCGTLYATTSSTFTLTQNITGITGTCFTIFGDDITIDGGGFSLVSATSTNTSPAISAGNYSSLTLKDIIATNFSKLVTSSSSVIISGNNINISNKTISVNNLSVQAGILNIATTTIFADILNINYTTSVTGTSTASSTALSSLVINNFNYYSRPISGLIFQNSWIVRTDIKRNWSSITSSANGTKLAAVVDGGQIYTSTDSGITWTARNSNRVWKSITSSVDGTKLAAVVNGGQIYTSTDSGVSWTPRDSSRVWSSIVSSADGTKLAATTNGGQIYTSTNSGITWIARASGSRAWLSMASSADGNKLAAAVDGGQIYTSTDSGVTWTARASGSRSWRSITSSADGVKLAAVDYGGDIYTSTNSGVTWTVRPFYSYIEWLSITSSADGTKLVAVAGYYSKYISNDSGVTWTVMDHIGIPSAQQYNAVTSSADGTKFLMTASDGLIFSYATILPDLSVNTLYPTASSTISSWTPYISWGIATSCYYSYNNFTSTSTANCSLDGSDISAPSNGVNTLYIKAVDNLGNIRTNNISFTYTNQDILINTPVLNSIYSAATWLPSVDYSVSNQTLISCYYSYNNFTSTSTANCSLDGSDISAPSNGVNTLYIKAVDNLGNIRTNNISFTYTNQDILINTPVLNSIYSAATWLPSVDYSVSNQTLISCYYSYNNFTSTSTANCSLDGSDISAPSTTGTTTIYIKTINNTNTVNIATSTFIYQSEFFRSEQNYWQTVAGSADGVKLVAATEPGGGGSIYTSTDSGVTWTIRYSTNKVWRSVASSADGVNLVAVAGFSQIYTSSDSGVTWIARDSSRDWRSVTSSADGKKLTAVAYGDYIYTSTNSGVTWTARIYSGNWQAVTSSADGVKLAATASGGQIYTSTDSGVTWTARASGSRAWLSIASSVDGTKLAAVVDGGQIYTSTDSGINWTARASGSRAWRAITSSVDGTKLAATVYGGQIYTSADSGVAWTAVDSVRYWSGITSSTDGNKIIALTNRTFTFFECFCNSPGYVYVYNNPNPGLSVDIMLPAASTVITSWTPNVSWGVATSCYYSYNNFTSTSTANCALNGSDISAPSVGTSTLYVKGFYNSSMDTDSKIFSYSKYYWCGTVNSTWNNASNWYTTGSCSVNIGSVPTSINEVILVGTTSPIISIATTSIPFLINSSGLTGSASTTGIIFSNGVVNTVNIIGNATFYDTSYNTGAITGNVNFMSASSGLLVLSGSMKLGGSISGTIKGGDSVLISSIVFNNSSSNEMIIPSGINTIFNNSSFNQGVINGDAVFNNTSPFTIGTVNGSVVLSGFAQTIQGINNVTNLTKQSSNRDTLYFTSGSVLNVSGLLILTGSDINNLLTIRSTTPGIYANLGINGSESMNFLRIKDINNTGTLLDLSALVAYDDDGNIGFIFPPNSTPSSRNGVTSSYTAPTIPPSRIILPTSNPSSPTINNSAANGNPISGGSLDIFFIKNIKPLLFDPTINFNIINNNLNTLNLGNTKIPQLFINFSTQEEIVFTPAPTKFLTNTFKFISDLILKKNIHKTKFGINIDNDKDLVNLAVKPVRLNNDSIKNDPEGFYIMINNININTYLTTDKKTGELAQLVKVLPGQKIEIKLNIADNSNIKGVFFDNDLYFNKDGVFVTVPSKPGVYILKTNSSPINIFIEVVEPVKIQGSSLKIKLINWVKGLFR